VWRRKQQETPVSRPWIALLERVRDELYIANFLSLLLVCIAFWIGWYTRPYHLTYPSIAAHSINLFAQFLLLCTTIVKTSYWSLTITLIFVAVYYVFHLWYYFQYGVWIYNALDPFSSYTLWVSLIVGIPLGIVVAYYIFVRLNYWKNRWVASYLDQHCTSMSLWRVYNTDPLEKGRRRHTYGITEQERHFIGFYLGILLQGLLLILCILYAVFTDWDAVFVTNVSDLRIYMSIILILASFLLLYDVGVRPWWWHYSAFSWQYIITSTSGANTPLERESFDWSFVKLLLFFTPTLWFLYTTYSDHTFYYVLGFAILQLLYVSCQVYLFWLYKSVLQLIQSRGYESFSQQVVHRHYFS
jgi:hypothetical protein